MDDEKHNESRPLKSTMMKPHLDTDPKLQKLQIERDELRRTAEGLENAVDVQDAAKQIYDVIMNAQEPLGDPENRPECFVGETMVTMADGSQKEIRDIQMGDEVRCMEMVKGELKCTQSTVVQLFRYAVPQERVATLSLSCGSEEKTLRCTGSHPFWSHAKQQWCTVNGDIKGYGTVEHGDVFVDESQKQWIVQSLGFRNPWSREETHVYDICVQGVHTYLANGILVHNKCPCVIL